MRHYMSHSRDYICPASLEQLGGWQTFTFLPESFKQEESGEALPGWEEVNYLERLNQKRDGQTEISC